MAQRIHTAPYGTSCPCWFSLNTWVQSLTLSALTFKEQRPFSYKHLGAKCLLMLQVPLEQDCQPAPCSGERLAMHEPKCPTPLLVQRAQHNSIYSSFHHPAPAQHDPDAGLMVVPSPHKQASYSKAKSCSPFCLAVLANWIILKKRTPPEMANF